MLHTVSVLKSSILHFVEAVPTNLAPETPIFFHDRLIRLPTLLAIIIGKHER